MAEYAFGVLVQGVHRRGVGALPPQRVEYLAGVGFGRPAGGDAGQECRNLVLHGAAAGILAEKPFEERPFRLLAPCEGGFGTLFGGVALG